MTMDYIYDSAGTVTSVKVDGKTYEVPERLRGMFPGRHLQDMHSGVVNISSTVEDIKDSYKPKDLDLDASSSILVTMEATHTGYYNDNNWLYETAGVQRNLPTWTDNGGRPYIDSHDMQGPTYGRVQDSRFTETRINTLRDDEEPQQMGYTDLDVKVGDEEEMERIVDERSLYVSKGSSPNGPAYCRICGHDLYSQGPSTPRRYRIDGAIDDSYLNDDAPGYFGEVLDMTNEEFWDLEQEEGGAWTAKCRHVRGLDAPLGDGEMLTTGWRITSCRNKEISRVPTPADHNRDTGEYAHIREVHDAVQGMSPEEAESYVRDRCSSVDNGTRTARFSIASEKDLYRPSTPQEAQDMARQTGYAQMHDVSLWNVINAVNKTTPIEDRVQEYWEKGGRFVITEKKEDDYTLSDRLDQTPSEFGAWLRAADMTRDEKRMIDKLYVNKFLRGRA